MGKLKIEDMLVYLGIELDDQLRRVLKVLANGELIGENELAEKLDLKINTVRKALYKLSSKAYVSYSKAKSIDKKWWYVYSWKIDLDKIKYDYLKKKNNELNNLKSLLEIEETSAFFCSKCEKRFDYHEAMDQNFECECCNKSLSEVASASRIRKMKKQIADLEEEIAAIK